MTLDALIMLAGALVAVLPFLGFPNSWDSVFLFLLGVFVIGLGIVVRRRIGEGSASQQGSSSTFVESLPSWQAGTPRPEGGHEES
ncbi:hypothetical protein A3A39_04245 [Candidatus Kaiserbacteria bacterium RIFCSPLOWO2_01_FULL_54_13]|uniref:Uncharacterized protein n=1 Tax=Candidatus Kaiserbacteria bacterium RIFCSPLOWO2_01_FULL_54_13 TaxID=1798512 RepID=A0A1F6F3C0_9BACT|nr:MAG: hypothetical protein A3A39_04245 [Candidatus Kaiserbacteria bacterium RIFCSPLOWO2_01_FULL_54_13]